MIIYDKLHWLNGIIANVFLYEDSGDSDEEKERLILVDTGMRGRPRVLTYLEKLNREPTDITHILVTHADVDHVGNLAALQKATGATVIAGEKTAALLIKGEPSSHGDGNFGDLAQRFGGYEAVPAELIQIVHNGDRLDLIDGLDVIATPGHVYDHIAFYSKRHGIIFAGDALNSRGNALSLNGAMINADNKQAAVSATKLLNLAPVLFACGHGKPFFHDHTHLEAMFMSLRN